MRTENALMTIRCFLAVCREGRSVHSFRYARWDSHRGVTIVPLPTAVLCDFTEMAQCRVVYMSGFDPGLSLMAIRGTTEMAWEAGTLLELSFFI